MSSKKQRPRGIKGSTKLSNRMIDLYQIFPKLGGKYLYNKEVNGVFYYVVGQYIDGEKTLMIGVADWKRLWAKDPAAGHAEQGIWPIVLTEYHVRTSMPDEQLKYIMYHLNRIFTFSSDVERWHRSLANAEHEKKITKPIPNSKPKSKAVRSKHRKLKKPGSS